MEELGKMYLVRKKPNIKAAESKVIKERRGERAGVLISPDFAPCDHLLIQRLVSVPKKCALKMVK